MHLHLEYQGLVESIADAWVAKVRTGIIVCESVLDLTNVTSRSRSCKVSLLRLCLQSQPVGYHIFVCRFPAKPFCCDCHHARAQGLESNTSRACWN